MNWSALYPGKNPFWWRLFPADNQNRHVRFEPGGLHLAGQNSDHVVEEFALGFGWHQPIGNYRITIFCLQGEWGPCSYLREGRFPRARQNVTGGAAQPG